MHGKAISMLWRELFLDISLPVQQLECDFLGTPCGNITPASKAAIAPIEWRL